MLDYQTATGVLVFPRVESKDHAFENDYVISDGDEAFNLSVCKDARGGHGAKYENGWRMNREEMWEGERNADSLIKR